MAAHGTIPASLNRLSGATFFAHSLRFYFHDDGVRNSLIQSFNPLALRANGGQLWENCLVAERRKANQRRGQTVNHYFWRTYDQKEIDCIEEYGGKLHGHEFKWQKESLPNAPRREFLAAYPESELAVIHQENFEEFVL